MGITAPLESVPAEAIGGLAVGVTPLEMADAYATLASGGIHHDADRDRAGSNSPTARSTKPTTDRGDRVLTEGQAYEVTKMLEGVITAGHRRRLHLHGLHRRRPARPAPPRASPTPGSSATRRSTRPPSGSDTRSRAKRPASAARRPARSGAPSWNPPSDGNCPEFQEPSSLPELSGLQQRTHPLLLGLRAEHGRRRIRRARKAGKGRKGGKERRGRGRKSRTANPHLRRNRARLPPPLRRRRRRPGPAAASLPRTESH